MTDITPAQLHMSVLMSSNDGWLPSITGGETAPGIHGVIVIGRHGIGVRTPNAAAVAAATIGLAGLMHIPKGIIFTNGI